MNHERVNLSIIQSINQSISGYDNRISWNNESKPSSIGVEFLRVERVFFAECFDFCVEFVHQQIDGFTLFHQTDFRLLTQCHQSGQGGQEEEEEREEEMAEKEASRQ